MTETTAPLARCARCGRTPAEVPGEWNAEFEEGYVVAYVCPDDQTAEDNAEAVINDATGATSEGRIQEDDPAVLALADVLHDVALTVLREWLTEIATSDRERTLDPYALADRALARFLPQLGGKPEDATEAWRDQVAAVFVDLVNDLERGSAD